MAKSSLRHNTYLLGTVGDLVSSKKIILFNKKKTTTATVSGKVVAIPYMSLNNLKDIWKILRNSEEKEYIEVTREAETDAFSIETTRTKAIGGFYNIIYINSLDDDVIGFTEFFTVQGKEYVSEIKITINFTGIVNPGIDLEILSPTSRYSFTAERFLGDNLWEYTSKEKAKKQLLDVVGYPRYSTHVESLITSNCSDFLDSYSVSPDMSAYKLGIGKDMEVDPYNTGFENTQVGYCWEDSTSEIDIVAYLWSEQRYRMVSLLRKNCFGNPLEYSRGSYSTAPANIKFFSGRYAVLTDYRIYDTLLEKILDLGYYSYRYVMDMSGRNSVPLKVPILSENNDISEYAPEIKSMSLYHPRSASSLLMKNNSWYIFSEGEDHLIISGVKSAYRIRKSELDNVYFINSQTLFIINEDVSASTYNIKIYRSPGKFNLSSDILGTSFHVGYPDDEITIDTTKGTDPTTINKLGEYRRGLLPSSLYELKFFGSLGGLIFYRTGNIINYL